jgi:hypothetical protein
MRRTKVRYKIHCVLTVTYCSEGYCVKVMRKYGSEVFGCDFDFNSLSLPFLQLYEYLRGYLLSCACMQLTASLYNETEGYIRVYAVTKFSDNWNCFCLMTYSVFRRRRKCYSVCDCASDDRVCRKEKPNV